MATSHNQATASAGGTAVLFAANKQRNMLILNVPLSSSGDVRVAFGVNASSTVGIEVTRGIGLVLQGGEVPTEEIRVYGSSGTEIIDGAEGSRPSNVGP